MINKLLCLIFIIFLSLLNNTFANDLSDCKRHIINENYIDAVKSCEESCNQNNGEGCTNLGVLYYNGQGIYTSKKQAANYFQKGCDLGNQRGCYYLEGKLMIPHPKVGKQAPPHSPSTKQFDIFAAKAFSKALNAHSPSTKQFDIIAFLLVTGPITYIIITVVINFVRKLITKKQRDTANRNRKKEETKRNNSSDYAKNTNYSSSSNKTGNNNQTHDESNNTAVFAELFALAGFVAKAQGTISQKQIQEVTKALNELELSYQERKYYQDKFNFGKSLDFAPSESCQKLASLLDGMHPKKKRAFISFSLDLLLPVIFADGVISDEERKRLLMITRALALGVIDTNNLINEYINRYSKSQKEEETKRNNSSDHTKNTNYNSSSHTTGSKEQTDRTQTHSESDNNSSDYTKNTNYSSSSHTTGSKEQTDRTQTHSESDNNSVFAELFALAGFVAKAQGTISKKQIQEVIKALNKLGLSSQERKYYQDKFNFGKSLHFAPSESCQKLASMVDGMNSEEKKAFILFSLDLLLPVIFADGEISNEERKRLLMITRALDINDVLINDLVNEYINRYSEYDSEPKNEFEKALRILGLSKNSQFEEAKAKYRILIKKYHPDKVGLLHLTAEQEAQIREEYNKKSKEINEAFDIIRAHFGR